MILPVVRAAAVLAVVVALLGCTVVAPTPSPADPMASALADPFEPADVARAVDALAAGGVPVRIRPTESPLAAVEAPSRMALLRFQARNLALEAHRRGGTLGSELDDLMAAVGGPPVSQLIPAWARSAGTPAAAAAAQLLSQTMTTEPDSMVIPGLVVALFVADLAGPAPVAGQASRSAVGPVTVAAEGDFCDQVSAYLSASLAGLVDPEPEVNPDWVARVIDTYGGPNANPEELRNAVAALSLLVYATSVAHPWIPLLIANPGETHYLVGDDELSSGTKEFRLAVDTGAGAFAEEAAECADLAELQLQEHELEGTPVGWLAPVLPLHAVDIEGDPEIDEFGKAVMEYQTRTETEELHKEGTLASRPISAVAVLRRAEIGDIETMVGGLITGGRLGAAAPAVVAEWDRSAVLLRELLYPRGLALVTISWHEPREPTPSPATPEPPPETGEPQPVPCSDGCASTNGDPHLSTVDGHAYDFQAAGEFVLLRSADGAIELQGRQEPYPGTNNVTINTALAMRVGSERIVVGFDAEAQALRATLDGAPVDPFAETPLSGGGRIVPNARGFGIAAPDGTTAWALGVGSYGINILVEPSDDLRINGSGILGPVGEGALVPALPDGRVLPNTDDPHAAYVAVYEQFADAWRVTTETSLFDYDAGESTDTFTVRGYPAEADLIGLDDLTAEQRAAGEQACQMISDTLLHAQCVFDVGLTFDPAFANGYEITDNLLQTGSLPSAEARIRVANVYGGVGDGEGLDVYGFSNDGAALLASVPFGSVSDWLNPGYREFFDGTRSSEVAFHRQGIGDPLFTETNDWRYSRQVTYLVGTGPADNILPGGRGVWLGSIQEDDPSLPVAPPDQALLIVDAIGLSETTDEDFFNLSAGDGCLLPPDSDSEFPVGAVVGPGSRNPMLIAPGPQTVTVHLEGEREFGDIFDCDNEPIGPGVAVNLGAGQRAALLLYATPTNPMVRMLLVPMDSTMPLAPPATPAPVSTGVEVTAAPR